MSIVSNQNDVFASLGLAGSGKSAAPTNRADELGLGTFLKLMVTQLNNQDPFKPMENGEFLGQIAQFASVTGLDKLNASFDDLAGSITSNQALQAGALVGREVLVPTDAGHLAAGGSVRGQVQLDQSSTEVTLRVTDAVGQLVREMPLGTAPAGPLSFAWDGIDDGGNHVAPGIYRVSIEAQQGDRNVELRTQMFSRVESVNLGGAGGLTLNLQGLGPVAFANVQQIH